MKVNLIILIALLFAGTVKPQGHGNGSAYRQTIRVEWGKYGPCIWDSPTGAEGPHGCVGPVDSANPRPQTITIEWMPEGLILR